MIRRPPRSTLFPYTTLSISSSEPSPRVCTGTPARRAATITESSVASWLNVSSPSRSEEHTSELQSLTNLVCRLLLEKKNQQREPGDAGDKHATQFARQ